MSISIHTACESLLYSEKKFMFCTGSRGTDCVSHVKGGRSDLYRPEIRATRYRRRMHILCRGGGILSVQTNRSCSGLDKLQIPMKGRRQQSQIKAGMRIAPMSTAVAIIRITCIVYYLSKNIWSYACMCRTHTNFSRCFRGKNSFHILIIQQFKLNYIVTVD